MAVQSIPHSFPLGGPACEPTSHVGPAAALPTPVSDIMRLRGRNFAARIMEVLGVSNSPARVIALVQPPGRVRPDASWPLADYIRWWQEDGSKGLSPGSRDTYRAGIKPVVARLGDIPLGEIVTSDIQGVIEAEIARGQSDSSVALVKASIASAMKVAVRDGILAHSPARAVKAPSAGVSDRVPLTAEEHTALCDYLMGPAWCPIYTPIVLMLQVGMRVGEVLAPRACDLSLSGQPPTLRVELQAPRSTTLFGRRARLKTDRSKRTVPLTPVAVEAIERRIALHPRPPTDDDWVLGKTLDAPFSRNGIRKALRAACKGAGVPAIVPHTARRTFVTLARERNVKVEVLVQIIGDSEVTVIKHYAHVGPNDAAAALAMMFAPRAQSTT